MQSTLKEAIEALWLPFCISMMGFIVRVARSGISSWRNFISSLFCSAFAGVIAHWFLAGSGINTQIASAVIAMSGYCGGALIDAVSNRILREVNNVSHNNISHDGFPRFDGNTKPYDEATSTEEEQCPSDGDNVPHKGE